jgi:hypothetical protein
MKLKMPKSKKSGMAKLTPASASRIRSKAKNILSNAGKLRLPMSDPDSAAGAAT